jgi:hypothetical protein
MDVWASAAQYITPLYKYVICIMGYKILIWPSINFWSVSFIKKMSIFDNVDHLFGNIKFGYTYRLSYYYFKFVYN